MIKQSRRNLVEIKDERIIKTANIKDNSRPFRLKIESWALKVALLNGVNVPQVLSYYKISNKEILELKLIKGRSISNLSKKKACEYIFKVGNQMLLLNNVSNNFGWINTNNFCGNFSSWKNFLSFFLKRYGQRLINNKIINQKDIDKINYEMNGIDLKFTNPYLLHRDLKPDNFIIGNDDQVFIVDWENVILGDPLYDISTFAANYGRNRLWESLIEGYEYEYDVNTKKYIFYELLCLIGVIDFYRKNNINFNGKVKAFNNLITQL